MSTYIALVHHPVRDRQGESITTAVTNLDVHDLARSARTYDLAGYYLVTPIDAQRRLVEQIVRHWEGSSDPKAGDRFEALRLIRCVPSIDAARNAIAEREGRPPRSVVTAASPPPGRPVASYATLGAQMRSSEEPFLILFGTGHGLTPEVLAAGDEVLPPIRGVGGFNHLSVRAAAAIVLDRLFGERGAARD